MAPEGIPWAESEISPLEQFEWAVLAWQETVEEQSNSILPVEIYDKLSLARWDEEKLWNQQEELRKSELYISTLSSIEQQNLFIIIDEAAKRNFNNYIKNNGYIINKITLQAFEADFWLVFESRDDEFTERREDVAEHTREIADELKIFEGNREVFLQNKDSFSDIPNFQSVVQWLEDVNVENHEEVKAINEALKNTLASNFDQVVRVYEKLWKQENPDAPFESAVFQSFKAQAVSLDLSFSHSFDNYIENSPRRVTDIPNLVHQAQIIGGIWTEDFKKYGSIVEATQDGQTTRMDISNIPPTRSITLEWSNFSLPTRVPIWDFYSTISREWLVYESIENENRPKIDALEKLSDTEVQEFLQSDDFKKESLWNCIRIISIMIGLIGDTTLSGLFWKEFTSKNDLQVTLSSGWILTKKQELEKEIEKKKKDYEWTLQALVQKYHESLREQDKKTREVLIFLESIWITQIPQLLLNNVIEQINRNPKAYWFDIKINLSEWELGMDKVVHEGGLLQVNKKAFADIMNKMMGVEAINVWLIWSWAPVWDMNKFQTQLRESGLLGIWGIWIAMENLKKSSDEE